MNKNKRSYDLEKRTEEFSEGIIDLVRKIKKDIVTMPLLSQLVRSATSVGANYCEANGACSKKDFKNKIYICKKEAKETKYWLHLLSKASPQDVEICQVYWKEAQELTLIFSKIILTLEGKSE
jgi:four helix bundle protein